MFVLRSTATTLCLIAILGFTQPIFGQEEDFIETDRDSFTRSPKTVAEGRTVVEGAYTFLDQDAAFDGHLYPDLLVRYGLSEILEARLSWTYEEGKYAHLLPDESESIKEGQIIYGAKVFLTEARDWVPDSSLIISGYTPTNGNPEETDFSLEYAAGWEWESGVQLDWGLRWFSYIAEGDHYTEWAPSIVIKTPVGCERFNAHGEYFCLLSDDRDIDYRQHYVGPGAHYLITPNIEIGARGFWGVSPDAANFIWNAGMGVRF